MQGQGQQVEMGAENSALLSVDALTCIRGGRTLFSGLTLSLSAGQAVVVRGPNGIGKSSLLRVIAGLLDPAEGTITADARMALADEKLALDRELPLARALLFWAKLDGAGQGAVESALSDLGIAHLAEVPVRMLSTGQRKRAMLARVVASGAPIWLLDEPGNGLDAASLDLLAMAMAAHRLRGGAVLAVSHQPLDLPDALTISLGAA